MRSATVAVAVPVPGAPLAAGSLIITPPGPHVGGQEVTLLANDDVLIDVYNSVPRLCAEVNGESEVCDPGGIASRPATGLPAGWQGVAIGVPRWHFGPDGESDCGDDAVICRLLWRTEAGLLLASAPLSFAGPVEPKSIVLEADIDEQPGTIKLRASGFDSGQLAQDVFSPVQLRLIAEAVAPMSAFDVENLTLSWEITALCGFGPGDPPIGSDALTDLPSWWHGLPFDPTASQSVANSFYGGLCDWRAIDGPREIAEGEEVEIEIRREIYGRGGWLDCADAACFLEMALRWNYPMADGSTLGSDAIVARVLVDVP